MRQLLRVLPNLVRLIARLVNDPVLPRAAKIALAAARLMPSPPRCDSSALASVALTSKAAVSSP